MTQISTATSITVLETLRKLDDEFTAVATAIENGEFALWVGSGISRKVPNLGGLISRALEYFRQKATDTVTRKKFEPAFLAALKLGGIELAAAEPYLEQPFDSWPNKSAIVGVLWNQYSKLLDIRIQGEANDFVLWTAVDIRDAFVAPAPPECEHLCIAILILEGAVREIASGKWDGFIEAAVDRLGGGAGGILQVVVDPGHLRDAPGKARLLKFHGCIIHATEDPATYRKFLTANQAQITDWPENPDFAAMRNEVISIATNLKALMMGLSLQDNNLQTVFAKARRANAWPWPCEPKAQGHVFCEDHITDGQRAVLKTVYADSYNDSIAEIESSAHLRSWAEQVLLALVLKLVTDKLCELLYLRLSETAFVGDGNLMAEALHRIRDAVARLAVGDRTAFVNIAIGLWSRMVCLFRNGRLPAKPDAYEPISAEPLGHLANDRNVQAAGFGELGVALALLEHGQNTKLWTLGAPAISDLSAGALSIIASWPGAAPRAIFLVRSAAIALDLDKHGAFANDNSIVIHADDVWQQMRLSAAGGARKRSRAPGRTGKVETRHVSIAYILETEFDLIGLRKRFVAEMAL
jgi:hypothetical protein